MNLRFVTEKPFDSVLFRRGDLPVSIAELEAAFGKPKNGAWLFASEHHVYSLFKHKYNADNECMYAASSFSSREDDCKFFQWLANNLGKNSLWKESDLISKMESIGADVVLYKCAGKKCNTIAAQDHFLTEEGNLVCPNCNADAFPLDDGGWEEDQ